MPNKNNLITGSIELMAVVDGTNGASVTAITNYYQATSANTAPSYTANAQSPGSAWKTSQGSTTWNATNKYLWKVEVSTLTDSKGAVTYKSSTPCVVSIYTSNGNDAISLQLNTNSLVFPVIVNSNDQKVAEANAVPRTIIANMYSGNTPLSNVQIVNFTANQQILTVGQTAANQITVTPKANVVWADTSIDVSVGGTLNGVAIVRPATITIIGSTQGQTVTGPQGTSITNVVEEYQLSNSDNVANLVANNWFNPSDGTETRKAEPTSDNPYLWNRERIYFDNNTNQTTEPHISSVFSNSLVKTTNKYLTSTSKTAPGDSAGWKSLSEAMADFSATNKYLWNWEQVTYRDASKNQSNKRLVAVWGDKGDPGTPGSPGSPGPRGYSGCIYRRSEWEAGKSYRNDSESTRNGNKYIDVVTVTAADGITFREFICQQAHTSAIANKPTLGTFLTQQYWAEMNTVTSMRTPFADIAVAIIQYLQAHQVVLTDPNNSGKVYGAFGAASVTNGYPLWFGGETVEDAVFSVDKNGLLEANDVKIRGNLMQNFVRVTPENLQRYCHSFYSDEGDNETYVSAQIDLYKTGPLVILDSALESMADSVDIQLHMPGYPQNGLVPSNDDLWLMRSCINTPIYIYNYLTQGVGWCVAKKNTGGGYTGFCAALANSAKKVCKFSVTLFPDSTGVLNKTENPTWVGEVLGDVPGETISIIK